MRINIATFDNNRSTVYMKLFREKRKCFHNGIIFLAAVVDLIWLKQLNFSVEF